MFTFMYIKSSSFKNWINLEGTHHQTDKVAFLTG